MYNVISTTTTNSAETIRFPCAKRPLLPSKTKNKTKQTNKKTTSQLIMDLNVKTKAM